jgi:excisionase family DNA binding protein
MTDTSTRRRAPARTLPEDVKLLGWAAEQLAISPSTAYRLAAAGQLPGVFKVGGQWRVSVPRFLAVVHGSDPEDGSLDTEDDAAPP